MNKLSRFWIRRFIKHFARESNWHELNIRTGNLGYGWIHHGLIRLIKPKRVLVIGSQYGFIPAVCALACKHNRKGRVDFIDAGYDVDKIPQDINHWGGVGFWKKVDVKKHFKKFGLDKYIDFYLMTSQEFREKHANKKWDYIYLDADHSYNGVKKDFNMFWPRLKRGGYLAFHDIYVKKQGGFEYGVIKLWQELKVKNYQTIEFPGKFGLGIVKK